MKLGNRTVRYFRTVAPIVICALFFGGCASKEPQIITKTVYQEVRTPVACIEKMPEKPKFEANDPQSARELMEYFKTCEELLKGCANERAGN